MHICIHGISNYTLFELILIPYFSTMKNIETYIVDSFTNEPFKGNPAGVCITTEQLEEIEMLKIAKELGLSETCFVGVKNHNGEFPIRYFSPIMEIPLCGHATLAASKVLFEKNKSSTITFKNIQGLTLPVKKEGESINMEFPIYDTSPQEAPQKLIDALGLTEILNSEYNSETNILLLEIESSLTLKELTPDFNKLVKSHSQINGVLVTAASENKNFDFESRYFWPWSGTNEDPVTGGTHTFLAKYWSTRLNKMKMMSFQCSKRTGFMEVELLNNEKMKIKSKAQIILRGVLTL